MMDDYQIKRTKRETVTLTRSDKFLGSIIIDDNLDSSDLTLLIDDGQGEVEIVNAPKEILYEFLAGVFNALTNR